MATIVLSGSTSQTFNAAPGDVFIVDPSYTGFVTINGGPYTVEFNASNSNFASIALGGTSTVNYNNGADAGDVGLLGRGGDITINASSGSTLNGVSNNGLGGKITVRAGDDVRVENGFEGSKTNSVDLEFGDRAFIGSPGGFATDAITAGSQSSGGLDHRIVLGNDSTVEGTIAFGGTNTLTAEFGDNVRLDTFQFNDGGAGFSGVSNITAGDNFEVDGNFGWSTSQTNFTAGDGWKFKNLDASGAEDIRLGFPDKFYNSSVSGMDFNNTSPGDGISVRAPDNPGDKAEFEAAARAAGWGQNSDGSWSPNNAGSGDFPNFNQFQLNYGNVQIEQFDQSAGPVGPVGGDNPPSFTNISDGQFINVAENGTFVVDAEATDPDGGPLTFSISGGADAGRFTIDPNTGVLSFTSPPDFEAQDSAVGNDAIFDVTVRVTDPQGNFDDNPLFVNVTDVDEGTPPPPPSSPTIDLVVVGGAATNGAGDAIVTEGDGPITFEAIRTGDLSNSQAVVVSSSDSSEATAPLIVTIPAGSDRVSFQVTPQDDTDIDGTQSATISASLFGNSSVSTTQNVIVQDNDSAPAPTGTVEGRLYTDTDQDDTELLNSGGSGGSGNPNLSGRDPIEPTGNIVRIDDSPSFAQIDADPNKTYVIGANASGNIIFRGDVVNVHFEAGNTSTAASVNALSVGTFNVSIEDGASAGLINAGTVQDDFTLIAGDNTTIFSIDGPERADTDIVLGQNTTVTDDISLSSDGSGNTASINLEVESGSNIGGDVFINSLTRGDINFGDNVTIQGTVDLEMNGTEEGHNLTAGEFFRVETQMFGSSGDDVFVIGNNWSFDIRMENGSDSATLGYVEPGQTGSLDGGTFAFGDRDAIRITPQPGQEAAFDAAAQAAGWADNGDGTYSPVFSGDERDGNDYDFSFGGFAAAFFEDVADPVTGSITLEPGIENAVVILEDTSGNEVARTTTDADGNYSFDVPAGDYRIQVPTNINGQTIITQDVGDPQFDSDANPGSGESDTFTVPANGTLSDIDVGYDPAGAPTLDLVVVGGAAVQSDGDALVTEGDGPVTFEVIRTGDLSQDQTVFISSFDTSEATAPFSVTIPAGSDRVSFQVDPQDDTIVDGTQTATIEARATIDGTFVSTTQDVIVQDNDVANQAPTANDDAVSVNEGDSVTFNVLANDTDPEGQDLDILGTPTAANGSVTFDAETGEITYTPNVGFTGTDTISYTAVDEGGLTDTATLTVNVVDVPLADETVNQIYLGNFPSTNTQGDADSNAEGAANLLGTYDGNDISVEQVGYTKQFGFVFDDESNIFGTTMTYDLGSGPQVVEADETIRYTADFELADGTTLTGVDVRVIQSTNGDVFLETWNEPNLTFTDPPGQDVTLLETVPISSVELTGITNQLIDRFDPIGLDATIDGNEAPVIVNDGDVTIPENQVEVVNLDAVDPDGDDVTWSITGGADAGLFNIDPATGQLNFNSAPDFENPQDVGTNNVYEVEVTATDPDGATDVETLNVTVADVNEAPVVTAAPDISVEENTTGPVADVDAVDPDGDTLTYAIVGGPDAGDFTIDPTTGELSFVTPPDFENPADDNGDNVYEVQVQATDPDGLSTPVETVNVSVTDVDENGEPVIVNAGDVTIPENQVEVVNLDAVDPDSDPVTWSITGGADAGLFNIDPATGQLNFNTAPDFENPQDVGTDNVYEVEVTATDPGGLTDVETLNVTIADINEAPTANDDTLTVQENGSGTINVLGNDTDPENGDLDIQGTPTAANGVLDVDNETGEITYTPNAGFVGTDTITYTTVDEGGLTDTATLSVNVTALPIGTLSGRIFSDDNGNNTEVDASLLNFDAGIEGVEVRLLDASGTTVIATTTSGPNGEYSFDVPIGDYRVGVDTTLDGRGLIDQNIGFSDASDSDADPSTGVTDVFTVTEVQSQPLRNVDIGYQPNQAPDVTGPAAVGVDEGESGVVADFDASDPEGQPVTFTLEGPDADKFTIDPTTGELSLTDLADFENPDDDNSDGIYEVTVVGTDPDGLRDEQPVQVTVNDVNEAPVLDPITDPTIPENSTDPVHGRGHRPRWRSAGLLAGRARRGQVRHRPRQRRSHAGRTARCREPDRRHLSMPK